MRSASSVDSAARFSRSLRSACLAIGLSLLLAACEQGGYSDAAHALNDLGVAQMGRFEYAAAHGTFTGLVDANPGWHEARVNLAIATLNRQDEGDEQRALELALAVLDENATQVRAQYLAGLVNLYVGNPGVAASWFMQVVEADPDDAYAAYFLGQSRLQTGDYDAASRWLVEATRIEPYLRSAYWAGAQAMRRTGRDEDAAELLAAYQRFAPNPAARVAGFSYKRMGPKAEARSVTPTPPPVPRTQPDGPLFAESQVIERNLPAGAGTTLTTVDLDADGYADVFVAGPGGAAFFRGTARTFTAAPHPLTLLAAGRAPLWGDVNDDGLVDVVFCGASSAIHYQNADGDWNETRNLPKPCTDAALFDADHDGDLDVFVTGSEGNELFSNNRDGTFRTLAADLGLTGSPGRQVLVADLDADRDVDILVVGASAPHEIWQNDRTWNYARFEGYAGLRDADITALTFLDADADGHLEIYGATETALLRWPDRASPAAEALQIAGARTLTTADLDGNGSADLITLADGVVTAHLAGGAAEVARGTDLVLPVTLDGTRGPGLVTLAGGTLRWWAPGSGRHSYLTVRPSGKSEAEQMRSNASGISTKLRVRAEGRWSNVAALDAHSGPGQSLAPMSVGLGGAPKADYIALEWSDGVTQTEIDLLPGLHDIDEVQRQLASCPVIFAWNGDEYGFVSDVLGVAGLGFFTRPGETASPRPFERYLLRDDQLRAREGRYQLKLTEPMEENAYLDTVSITVWDVPKDVQLALDERMGTGTLPVTGRPLFWKHAHVPVRATDRLGKDILADVTTADRRAAPPGPLDPRFLGLLAEPQVITLEFDAPLPTDAVLLAEGWVEYGYSQTVFAAWQAGISYEPPTLEARGADGAWVTVAPGFGYPAGMPRQMAMPLDLPEDTVGLRLTSNMEIYWDDLRVVEETAAPSGATSRSLSPRVARVARTGFAERVNGPQRVPHYDYRVRTPYWDTKSLRGFYSALGDVLPLVEEADGALAIIGGGEEIHLEFDAPPPPEDGMRRHVVVEFNGWAKDMDLYTADGETVGPLPEPPGLTRDAKAARDALHARYNVRFQEGM